jgi:gluconokinase
MVFVITGTTESDTNMVGKLLADDLSWEFVDAKNLHPPAHLERPNSKYSQVNADSSWERDALLAAIDFWIYEWRDVVVSCALLRERDQRQLSKTSLLVKVVCLETSTSPVNSCTNIFDRSSGVLVSEHPDGSCGTRESEQEVLKVDSSRDVEDIVAEIVGALILNRRSPLYAKTS